MNTIAEMEGRLQQANQLTEDAIHKRDSLAIGTPARDEWTGIVFSCMREVHHLKSDIGRARQMASDVVSPR